MKRSALHDAFRPRVILTLMLVAAVCPYFGIGDLLHAGTERWRFYVETPREMLESGNNHPTSYNQGSTSP